MLKRAAKLAVKVIAALVILCLAGTGILLAVLWREHKTEVVLPKPTGPYAVGRTIFTWSYNKSSNNKSVNNSAREGPDSSVAAREVVVWIWYPAAQAGTAKTVDYLPTEWRLALAQYSGIIMSDFLTRDLSLVKVHSLADREVSADQPSYPVVIMRAGGGALSANYTALAEDLASHGYVVAGIDAPYRTSVVVLPQGRIIVRPSQNDPDNLTPVQANSLINRLLPMWVDDIEFVTSQLERLNAADPSGKFTGRLDMKRLGIFGHSFGGAQGLEFCHDDPRCQAGIDLDGEPFGRVVRDGLKQPFMILLSDHSHEAADAAHKEILANLQSIYDRLPDGGYFITIRGANHFSFSDQMLVKCPLFIPLMRIAGLGRLDGRRGLAITAEYVHTFFDVYLKGKPRNAITELSTRYPEVSVEQR